VHGAARHHRLIRDPGLYLHEQRAQQAELPPRQQPQRRSAGVARQVEVGGFGEVPVEPFELPCSHPAGNKHCGDSGACDLLICGVVSRGVEARLCHVYRQLAAPNLYVVDRSLRLRTPRHHSGRFVGRSHTGTKVALAADAGDQNCQNPGG